MPPAASPTVAPTAAAPAPSPAAKPQAKTAPEAKVHPVLASLIQSYDTTVEKAESYYIEIIETIQKEKISRADVVATLMKARGITFETAQSQYSRMKGVWQNPEVLAQLKSGEITLKVAREKTSKKQTNPASSAVSTGTPGEATKKSEQESKEMRYDRCRKAHVAAVKECGFDLKSALMSFEADLKAAGIK